MDTQLMLYEQMSQLSSSMVSAAQTNDWDLLSDLEAKVADLRDQLMAETPSVQTRDETVKVRKIALIKKILEDDREVRSHAEPWMESVKMLLAGNVRQKAVQNAYGVGHR